LDEPNKYNKTVNVWNRW